MVEHSKIEWTNHTFNPWLGCTAISPACDHCYAEAQTARFKQVGWGAHAPRKRTSEAYWRQPLLWNDKAEKSGVRFKVFCASLADVFDNHKSILPEWRFDLWALIRATPHLDWLLLTKRPQNIERFLPAGWWGGYSNVWLGTTVENQPEANRRIPHLLATPATKRFLSCEPLLGPVDLGQFVFQHETTEAGFIDWVICGGESGPKARPMHPDWARSLRDQCQAAGVPFFFKQWGEWGDYTSNAGEHPAVEDRVILPSGGIIGGGHPKYGGMVEENWQERGGAWMSKVGKKRAGHLLDGLEWRQMPGPMLPAVCDHPDCNMPARTELDNEKLCKFHATEWLKGEQQAADDYQAEIDQLGIDYGDLKGGAA